jgi:integrase/recombinase XerD
VNSLRKEFLGTINKDKKTLERRFRGGFRHFITKDFDLLEINEIRQHIINNLKDSKLNPNNIQKIMQTLKRLFNYAIEEEYITRNPIKDSMIPKREKSKLLIFTHEEIQKLIEYFKVKDKEFALLIQLISITGTRINETLSMEWDDIDESKILIHGKNKHDRFLPMEALPELVEIFEQLKSYYNGTKLFRWNSPAPAQRILKRGCIELGFYVEDKSFHSIRKFVENYLIFEKGIDANIVAEFMGHSRQVQEEHYVKGYEQEAYFRKLTEQIKSERKL